MPKANFKQFFLVILTPIIALLAACTSPEEKKEIALNQASELRQAGRTEEALALLEKLTTEYPNDAEILKQIGDIFFEQNDTTMAAFFLEQAYAQNPDDLELLYQTYIALEAANQPAGKLLETYSDKAPKAMTPELWVKLGQYRVNTNQTQSALDAYLKGADPEQADPAVAATIGNLFVKLDNLPQAERWLTLATEKENPDALTALFSLLEIKVRQKEWKAAESIIVRIDEQFPGALDASQWASARSELARWRKAQEDMRLELEKAAKIEEAQAAEEAVVTAESNPAEETTPDEAADSEGKAQLLQDIEAAEALAITPAVEEASDTETIVPSDAGKTVAVDPSIANQPAQADLSLGVTYDQQGSSPVTDFTVESAPSATEVDSTLSEVINPIRPSEKPRPIGELLAEAESAMNDRDFALAITNYWQAISTANNRADIWNLLSQTYLIDGQLPNAETTALEAIRLAPDNISYTLDYLRVAQRSKKPDDFVIELETAHQRFPENPEINIALARAYERISKRDDTATKLYKNFIQLAPSHPLRPEAEAAIARLE